MSESALSTYVPPQLTRWVPVGVWSAAIWGTVSASIGLLIGGLIAASVVLNEGSFDPWFIQTSMTYAAGVGLAAFASRSLQAGTEDPRRRMASYGLLLMAVLGAVLVATVIAIWLRPGIVVTSPAAFVGLVGTYAALGVMVCLGVIAWEALKRALEKALHELREKEAMEKEMQLARDVQRGRLPERPPCIDSLDVAFACLPAKMVGGDTLDFLDLPEQRVGFTIGDVVGKGIAAALLMANVQAMVRALAPRQPDPSRLNGILSDAISTQAAGRFVTFAYVILDPCSGRLTYSLAGHHPPIIVGPQGTRVLESGGGLPLGISAGVGYETGEDQLAPGEMMVLYTDGVVEAPPRDGSDDEFGRKRLIQSLESCRDLSEKTLDTTLASIRAYTGDQPLADDTTILVVRRKSSEVDLGV